MKVFVLAPMENWICDRFVSEWHSTYPELFAKTPEDADVVWLLADWCWNRVDIQTLASKTVVATVHHLVPDKFDQSSFNEFMFRDKLVDFYHVPCLKTKQQVMKLSSKPVVSMPFWVNNVLWNEKPPVIKREDLGISNDVFLIGSFQRDTEGHDLKSPKLEKGPDLFCDAVEEISNSCQKKVEVLLAGWRRQYVMSRLEAANIRYHYRELPELDEVRDLYKMLDLYIVAARYEGGPQAIVEAATMQIPIISTDVGVASEILAHESIFEPGNASMAIPNTAYAKQAVSHFEFPNGIDKFRNMFAEYAKHRV